MLSSWRHACLALACLVGVSACRSSAPKERQPVRVGVSLLRISQPVFVAADRGFFAARGLDVELVRFDTAQPFADELATGRLDAAGYVALPILFGREGGPPAVRLATAIVEEDAHPLSFLLVLRDSPLHTPAQLRGKTIGVLPTLAYRRWLEAVLAKAGLAPADVTITPIAPPLQVEALAQKGVDALFTGDPMATAAIARVARPLRPGAEVPRALGSPFLFGAFAISERLTTERPAVAQALVDALDEAIDLLDDDEQAGRAAMTGYLREPERPFVDRFPPTSYRASRSVDAAMLDVALGREAGHRRAADVGWIPR